MFPNGFFAPRMFADQYFPPSGDSVFMFRHFASSLNGLGTGMGRFNPSMG